MESILCFWEQLLQRGWRILCRIFSWPVKLFRPDNGLIARLWNIKSKYEILWAICVNTVKITLRIFKMFIIYNIDTIRFMFLRLCPDSGQFGCSLSIELKAVVLLLLFLFLICSSNTERLWYPTTSSAVHEKQNHLWEMANINLFIAVL